MISIEICTKYHIVRMGFVVSLDELFFTMANQLSWLTFLSGPFSSQGIHVFPHIIDDKTISFLLRCFFCVCQHHQLIGFLSLLFFKRSGYFFSSKEVVGSSDFCCCCRHQLSWCPLYKAGSTSWMKTMLLLEGIDTGSRQAPHLKKQ